MICRTNIDQTNRSNSDCRVPAVIESSEIASGPPGLRLFRAFDDKPKPRRIDNNDDAYDGAPDSDAW
jgi:hypothetical protein